MIKKFIPIIITLIYGGIYYYLALPPLNLEAMAFYSFLINILIVYLIVSTISSLPNLVNTLNKNSTITMEHLKQVKGFKRSTKIVITSIITITIVIMIFNIVSSPLFNADKYASRISINETNTFNEDVASVDFDKIPLLDKSSTQKLGDRTMGQVPDLVSQFYVSDLYTQINYNGDIVRATPLEYDGLIKYFTNKDDGIGAYITVNSVDGSSELTELEEGMKYMRSAFFGEDLMRKLRFSYPTLNFGTEVFELDEEGNPYWIVPIIDYAGINLRKEIVGVVALDAVTGDSKKYNIDDIPEWIDRVYSSELIIEQINNWGTYQDGFWNSLFGQKNVVNTTEGYTYLVIDEDVYLYTGITSVAADEANLGFVLVNLRTKEANYYPLAGAEEFSAMKSAEGLVQEKGYQASFPLLINLNDRPTYLMSLKDAAGLVKMYAFVDVIDYQIVSVTDSSLGIDEAAEDYIKLINKEDPSTLEVITKDITVDEVINVVIDGNTYYYITDTDDNNYQVSIKIDEFNLPFIKKGSKLNISYVEGTVNIIQEIN